MLSLDAIFFSKVSLNSFTNNTCIGFTKRKRFTEKKNGTSKNILNVKYDTLMLFTNIDIKFFESWLNMEDQIQINVCNIYIFA